MRLLFILFIISICFSSYAQNVTSSFDRNMLSTNPSAAATRKFAQMSLGQTYKTVSSTVMPTYANAKDYKEDVKLNSSELRFTGGHRKYVPELYLGFNNVNKVTQQEGSSTKTTSDLQFIDNFLNVGIWINPRMSVGIRLHSPNFAFVNKTPGTTQNGTTYNAKSDITVKVFGASLGTTLVLGRGFFVGVFGNFDSEKSQYKNSYLDYSTDAQQNDDGSYSQSVQRFGAGLSYLSGSSLFHGFRTELSYSLMKVPTTDLALKQDNLAAEVKGALEIAWRGISFGGRIRMIKNGFYDQSDYIQRFFIQEPTSPQFTRTYGAFFSLNSERGHSFGLSGYAFPAKGDRKLDNGEQAPAKSNTVVLNVNYSYLF